jgi:hypothetical protein
MNFAFQNFIQRLDTATLCNQVSVLGDDTRGLKASRIVKSLQESRKITLEVPRDVGLSAKVDPALRRRYPIIG